MATITKANTKKGNSYRIKISLGKDQYSGKYLWHTETFKGSISEAKIRAKELEVQIANDELYQSQGLSCTDLVDKFMDYKSITLKRATFTQYNNSLKRFFLVSFAKHKIDDLTPEMFDKFFIQLKGSGLSGTSIHHIYKNIKTCLAFGVDRELMKSNPLDKIPVPKRSKSELNVPTPEQVNEALEDMRINCDWGYIATSIAVSTGMRRGEILGLQWSDIDLEELSIYISRSASDVKGVIEVSEPKTKDSIRKIYFGSSLKNILLDWKQEQTDRASVLEDRALLKTDYVFSNLFSTHKYLPIYNPSSLTGAWNKSVARTGLKGVRFHDLRHFHAIQLLITGNANIKDIQDRLGHSDSRITMDTYMRYIPEDRSRKVGQSADELLQLSNPVIEGEIVQK